jgi:hypothetical protein
MLSTWNAYISLAFGLAGLYHPVVKPGWGAPRTFADASSRPHHDMDADLYINSVRFLYTSGGYSRK